MSKQRCLRPQIYIMVGQNWANTPGLTLVNSTYNGPLWLNVLKSALINYEKANTQEVSSACQEQVTYFPSLTKAKMVKFLKIFILLGQTKIKTTGIFQSDKTLAPL